MVGKQLQNCFNAKDRPENTKTLIDSWLRLRVQTALFSEKKFVHLDAPPAVGNKDTERTRLSYANGRLQLWYAYLHGAELNKNASHSKSIHFSDSSQAVVSGSLMTEFF